MIYLLLAILCGSLFAILFKIFAQKGINTTTAIVGSYLASIIVGSFTIIEYGPTLLSLAPFYLQAIITGGFMAGAFFSMNCATLSRGVAVATVAARMSFIVPVVGSFLFFHSNEPQWNIVVLVALSLALIIYKRKDINVTTSHMWLYPLLVFFCYGISNLLLKHLQHSITLAGGSDKELQAITIITFLGALLTSIIFLFSKKERRKALHFTQKECMAALGLGTVNAGCTYFLMKSLTVIDPSVFYPVYNISIVVIAALAGLIGFGEKLSIWQWIGIALSIVALWLFFA